MAKLRFRMNVFWKWVISYTLAVLIMLGFMVGLSSYLISLIEKQISDTGVSTVARLEQNVDAMLGDLENLMTTIRLNANITTLYSVLGEQRPYHQYVMYSAIADLRAYAAANHMVDSGGLYAYFCNRGGARYLLTPCARYDLETGYSWSAYRDSVPYAQWIRLFDEPQPEVGTIILPAKNAAGRPMRTICLYMTMHRFSDGTVAATLCASVNMEALHRFVQDSLFLQGSTLCMLDEQGVPIFSMGLDGLQDACADYPFEPGRSIRYGENVVVSVQSPKTGFQYQYIVPQGEYLHRVGRAKLIIYLGMAVCFLIELAAIFLTTRRNYQPIRSLAANVARAVGRHEELPELGFSDLTSYVEGIIADNARVSELMNEQRRALRPVFLLRLLQGQVGSGYAFLQQCASYDVHFEGDRFFVALFGLPDYQGPAAQERDADILCFAIRNMTEELLGQKNICYALQDGALPVCIVNLQQSDAQAAAEAARQMAALAEVIENGFHTRLYVFISAVHSTFFGVSQAYSEVMETMDYRMMLSAGGERIVFCSAADSQPAGGGLYTLEQQQQFINYIRAKDFESAGRYMNDMMDSLFSSGISLDMARCCMFSIINTMINALSLISTRMDNAFFERMSPQTRLLHCTSVRALRRQMNEVLGQLRAYVTAKETDDVDTMLEAIHRTIRERYSDPNLNVSLVAFQLGMSISLLSRFYKKNTGEGLLDTISRYRVDQAKRLLRGGMRIKNVAAAAGFIDSNALIRAFKHYEGITPGQYKALDEGGRMEQT